MTDTTMWTASGRQIDVMEILPTDIELWDIAASLSMQARFLGHTAGPRGPGRSHLPFYSVAQHCLQVSLRCPEEYRLEGLMHDAAEAYTGDITRPMKALLERVAPGVLNQIERQIEQAIALRFQLTYPWPSVVHTADDLCCRIEKQNFWPAMGRGDESGLPVLPAVRLQCLLPGEAASFFMRVFHELNQKRSRG